MIQIYGGQAVRKAFFPAADVSARFLPAAAAKPEKRLPIDYRKGIRSLEKAIASMICIVIFQSMVLR